MILTSGIQQGGGKARQPGRPQKSQAHMAAPDHNKLRAGAAAALNKDGKGSAAGLSFGGKRGIQFIMADSVFALCQQGEGIPAGQLFPGPAADGAKDGIRRKDQHFALGAGRPGRFHQGDSGIGDAGFQQLGFLLGKLQTIHERDLLYCSCSTWSMMSCMKPFICGVSHLFLW